LVDKSGQSRGIDAAMGHTVHRNRRTECTVAEAEDFVERDLAAGGGLAEVDSELGLRGGGKFATADSLAGFGAASGVACRARRGRTGGPSDRTSIPCIFLV